MDWRRSLGGLILVWLAHCGPFEEEGPLPVAPPADREVWDAEFEIGRPRQSLVVRTTYLRENLKQEVAQADSGVWVEIRSVQGEWRSQMQARRLTLKFSGDWLGLGGEVALSAGDTLKAWADTLIWEGAESRLWMPGRVRLVTPEAEIEGEEWRSDAACRQWSLAAVDIRWHSRRGEGESPVRIRARRGRGWREGGAFVACDSVEVEEEGGVIRGSQAFFDQEEEILRLVGGVSGADSTRWFAAQEVECALRQRRLIARGAVEMRDEGEEGFALFADEVVEERETRHLSARGRPAVFEQTDRRIETGDLEYEQAGGRLEARGGVVFSEGDRRLEAGRLVYEPSQEKVQAEGEVILHSPEFEGMIRGGALSYDLRQESGKVEREPVLVRQTESEGRLEVGAGVLHFELKDRRLTGEGGIRAWTQDLEMRARWGQYEAEGERLSLVGEVALVHKKPEKELRTHLWADSAEVQWEGGEMAAIEVWGDLEGRVEPGANRIGWVKGSQAKLSFQEGDLKRIELNRGAELTYRRLDRDEISRFRGQKVDLYFADSDLRQIQISGQAGLLSRAPEEERIALNRVEGEEMEIFFEEGSIARIEMVSGIEGKYYPPSEP